MAQIPTTMTLPLPSLTIKVKLPPLYGLRLRLCALLIAMAARVGPHDVEIEIGPASTAFGAEWEDVLDTGIWLYRRHRQTDERCVLRSTDAGWEPVDQLWLDGEGDVPTRYVPPTAAAKAWATADDRGRVV